jgi:hypothetical protein
MDISREWEKSKEKRFNLPTLFSAYRAAGSRSHAATDVTADRLSCEGQGLLTEKQKKRKKRKKQRGTRVWHPVWANQTSKRNGFSLLQTVQ